MCIALCIRLSVISHPQPVDSPTHTTHRDGRERALSYYNNMYYYYDIIYGKTRVPFRLDSLNIILISVTQARVNNRFLRNVIYERVITHRAYIYIVHTR